MDFHLERELQYKATDQIKHAGLYQWAIVERDDRGADVGYDQIPWGWTTHFCAHVLSVSDRLGYESLDHRGDALPSTKITHRSTIQARLRPGSARDEPLWKEPSYRMFGTDRVIDDFRLDIVAATDDQPPGCTAWGSVSYTSEIDLNTHTTSDVVQFYLMVPQSTYDRYIWNIAQGLANDLVLSVGHVAGFYSEWSPSIATRSIKVLAGTEHVISNVKHFEPPRLGTVGKVDLVMNARRNLDRLPQEPGEAEEAEPEADERRGFRWPGRRW